ncbi:MAG: hypothetical protein QMC93_03125 [Patescibacteria group bacterium]|nr:hypothetical protein [Patescibacteria group bacterium]
MTKIFKKQSLISVSIILVGVFISFLIIQAQALDITYPVEELGNCQNKQECRVYCDKPENIIACVNFAQAHNLISPEEAERARAFAEMGEGPGGCKSKEECETYCDRQENMDICLEFAERNNLISPEELQKAKQIAKAIKEGAQLPGGCRGKEQCEQYCNNLEHIEECFAFAEKAGFIPAEELEEARKGMMAMKSGLKPPGNCRGKKQCEQYCSEPSHREECLNFAVAAGFIPEVETEMARKMMPLMMAGEMPGGCKSKEECKVYCADESHLEECANFALKAGLMKPEEAELFKKTGGKGPGGCQGKEQCEAFCNDSTNQETCFNFAKENGLIPQEEIEKMKEGMARLKEGLEMAPAEVLECLKSTVGPEILDKIRAGTLTPGPQIGDQVRNCFEQFMPRGPKGMPGEGVPVEEMSGETPAPVPRGAPEEVREQVLKRAGEMVRESLARLTPAMKECVISQLGQASFDKLQTGDFSGFTPEDSERIQRIVRECVERFKPVSSGEIPAGEMPPGERVCIQVITPAKNPQTGQCINFPTPCVIPPGWQKVEKCEREEIITPPGKMPSGEMMEPPAEIREFPPQTEIPPEQMIPLPQQEQEPQSFFEIVARFLGNIATFFEF